MTGKPETSCEYPASLLVAMLRAIKRKMISDVRSELESCILQVQWRMKVIAAQNLKEKEESTAHGLTRSC